MIPLKATLTGKLLLTLSALTLNEGSASEHRCEVQNVSVFSDDLQSVNLVCDGAKEAIAFLRAHGLDVSFGIDIELVDKLDNEAAAGHLVASSKKALMLNYSEFLKFGDWLRVPINTEIYRALAGHEVAHIVAAHNFQIPKPRVQAHEYIAYVTTFAILKKAQREIVLGEFSGDGFETEQQMNTTIYLCDPMRFGAEAYRHFTNKGKDNNFFYSILSGQVMAE